MYSKTLTFTSESEIEFRCYNNRVEIYVDSEQLGAINPSFPITLYVTVNSGVKSITLAEISNNEYAYQNNQDRTVIFNQENTGNQLHVEKCSSSNIFKCIGVDDENMGITCSSGECEEYFDISAELHFKSKMEQKNVGGTNVYRMFVRYSENVVSQCGSNPVCSAGLFCYTCIV